MTQHPSGTIAILHAGGSDDGREQQPQRIHQDVALTPVDFLPHAVSPNARHRRAFDTLAIQATRRRVWVPTADRPDVAAASAGYG